MESDGMEIIERAIAAVELGVSTVIVARKKEDGIEAYLLNRLAGQSRFDPRHKVSTWVFSNGSELLLCASARSGSDAYKRRHQGFGAPEIVTVR